ncbi:hypothetical protein F3G51_32290 [Pseudomonas aeruginosa]|nr:hypothetical protein F3G51_32290 [Pseudomonas aeruginosa]
MLSKFFSVEAAISAENLGIVPKGVATDTALNSQKYSLQNLNNLLIRGRPALACKSAVTCAVMRAM